MNTGVVANRQAQVVVASTRAANGVYTDRTGPLILEWLTERGFSCGEPDVVVDGDAVGTAISSALARNVALIITTGGTGLSPTDRTPEVTAEILDRLIVGLADAIRNAGVGSVPTALLSRGVAGVAGTTLVVNLPGSTGGVRDGLSVLDGVYAHALDQIAGADH